MRQVETHNETRKTNIFTHTRYIEIENYSSIYEFYESFIKIVNEIFQ